MSTTTQDHAAQVEALNHISGSRSGIAGGYHRHDWTSEKRAAAAAWAAHVPR